MTGEEMLETLDQVMETRIHDGLENGRMALLILYCWMVRRSATLKMYQYGSRSWCAVIIEINYVLRTTPLRLFVTGFCWHSDRTIRSIAKHISIPENPAYQDDEEIDDSLVAFLSAATEYPDLIKQAERKVNRTRKIRGGTIMWDSLGLTTLCY